LVISHRSVVMPAQQETIKGKKYEKEILDEARKAGDKPIGYDLAEQIWHCAIDGNKVTDIERDTVHYVMAEKPCTPEAKNYLHHKLSLLKKKCPGHLAPINTTHDATSPQQTIAGVKYERDLFNAAVSATKGGKTMSLEQAKKLWTTAMDGNKITDTEFRTVEFIMAHYRLHRDAFKFLEEKLQGEEKGKKRTFKGVSWNPEEEISKEAKDGVMTDAAGVADMDELPDFDEDDAEVEGVAKEEPKEGDAKKGSFAAIHASGFRDFLLKPELGRAIVDCGFEHPSEVQHECIPQAILGTDILCQAKSGMGKTAVFVLACLQQQKTDAADEEKGVKTLVICHTRELAYQIKHEFERFAKYMTTVKTGVVYGGIPIATDKEMLKTEKPQVLIGTPGRLLGLMREKDLVLDQVQQFVLDECDKCLDKIDMRKDIQQIFCGTPKKKQVMMFSATMTTETRGLCKKFMQDPHEISVDEESKLTLHGLLQYYVNLEEKEKNRKLNDLLDALEFNQVVIFVKSVQRATALDKLLLECNFPSIAIHSGLSQEDRIARYKQFKEFQKRIMVSTDLFGRGIDIERVNIVINYDMPEDSDSYLHRVGRAGRFGTKGLAITFASTDEDKEVLKQVQSRFEVDIGAMPAQIDTTSYLNA